MKKPAPARDAAAVLLHVLEEEPRVLWVRRAPAQPFLGGFYSLPGGGLCAADAGAPATGGADVALRVAALRELFEETGVLLVEPAADEALRDALREAYATSAAEGHARLAAAGRRLRTAELEPVGRWVTPAVSPIRFDARFYALGLRPAELPAALAPDPVEIDRAEWVTAADALARWSRARVLIAPPALAMLKVLAARGRVDAAAMTAVPGASGEETLIYEVVPGVQAFPLRTPTLPPATHTNSYLVGTGEAVLIEPASPYPEEIDLAVRWVAENAKRGIRPRAIVATHHHPDHVGGAAALRDRLGLPIWAHALTARRLRGRIAIDRELADDERIVLDGETPLTLRAVHTPGHAPGHLCFLEERSGAMIAGDMVASIGTIIVEPDDGDMELYLRSLGRMGELEPTLLLPAHGGPIEQPQRKLDEYLAHRLMREAKVLQALRAQAGPATAMDLVPRAYDDAPKVVWPLARLSTEAHLIKLEREGRVRREPDGEHWTALDS